MKTKLTSDTLNGIWAGIPLTWDEEDLLDEGALIENLRRLCDCGVHGIYTTGSTGEFYALDWPEFRRVVGVVLETVLPRGIPVQVGCSGDDTRDVRRQIEYALEAGADGVQVALPYWLEMTDDEMLRFFREVGCACDGLPLVHYNTPRAKRFLSVQDYRRVLEVAPNMVGVKYTLAGEHFGELQHALSTLPELSFFVAEDLLVSAMQLGAKGSYSSIVLLNPHYMLRMYELARARRWDEAITMQLRLASFQRELESHTRAMGLGGVDPVFDKGLAVAGGFMAGHQRTRSPYIGWSDEGIRRVRAWLVERYPEFVTR